jgi:hypothetical protein
VGKIPESVHLIEPIRAMLSELAELFKVCATCFPPLSDSPHCLQEVGETYDARDALLEKVATVAREISGLMLQLKNGGLVDQLGHFESDLSQYTR